MHRMFLNNNAACAHLTTELPSVAVAKRFVIYKRQPNAAEFNVREVVRSPVKKRERTKEYSYINECFFDLLLGDTRNNY